MIKYFQKLQAKKGFTLVELIVVIAIIGVLAAILIPTMLGYVTSSRVTSANSTAASLKNSIDNFLTDADTAGYGMKQSSNAQAAIFGQIDASGTWTLTLGKGWADPERGSAAFKVKANIGTWKEGSCSTVTGTSKKSDFTDFNAVSYLALQLRNLFPDLKGACFTAYLEGGKTLYLSYTADATQASNGTDVDWPNKSCFTAKACSWNGTTAGVSSKGYIIGTAPALTLGSAANGSLASSLFQTT
ncbi:MAG: DUF5021 domain-containing protein [Ruminiclostridium sp.]|nr:DUF5021 domain-containing protein [Ruminiclostridium sp.]